MTRNHFTARMAKSNQNGRGFGSNNNSTANNRNFNLTRSTQNRPHFKHNPKYVFNYYFIHSLITLSNLNP